MTPSGLADGQPPAGAGGKISRGSGTSAGVWVCLHWNGVLAAYHVWRQAVLGTDKAKPWHCGRARAGQRAVIRGEQGGDEFGV
jgi:hypothetical protein